MWMEEEAGLRLPLVPPVALGKTNPANVKLTWHSNGAKFEGLIQNVEALVLQGTAVGNTCPVWVNLLNGIADRPDGGLCGSPQADDLNIVCQPPELFRQRQGDPVPAQKRKPEKAGSE